MGTYLSERLRANSAYRCGGRYTGLAAQKGRIVRDDVRFQRGDIKVSERPKQPLKFSNVLPDLYDKISKMFRDIGEQQLIEQVNNLRIVALCNCNDIDCGSFWTIEPPVDHDSSDLNVQGFALPDTHGIAVELIEGHVAFVEIIPSDYGREVRTKIRDAFGANASSA